jgi:hypothetical protein
VKKYAGGGHKVNILLRELEKYKDDEKKVLLFTDRLDLSAIRSELVNKLRNF